jgi:hypothetical protein
LSIFAAWGFFRFDGESTLPPTAATDYCTCQVRNENSSVPVELI